MSPGHEYYWPIDTNIRTPFQGNPYMFSCDSGDENNTRRACTAGFQLYSNISITLVFTKIHLKDWKSMFYKVQDFIKSLENKAP